MCLTNISIMEKLTIKLASKPYIISACVSSHSPMAAERIPCLSREPLSASERGLSAQALRRDAYLTCVGGEEG